MTKDDNGDVAGVNCRIGSLEIGVFTLLGNVAVNCRIGSLENTNTQRPL